MPTQRQSRWQSCHSSRRTITIALALAACTLVFPGNADAGCLDWLFGRSNTYSANYPYAGYPAGGYGTAGIQPIGAPQLVGSTTTGGSPYAAQYAAQYGAQVGFPTTVSNPALTSAVVQAQRPSLPTVSSLGTGLVPVQSFSNPNVYTGLPAGTPSAGLASPQSVYRLPASGVPVSSVPVSSVPVSSVPLQPSMGLQAQAAFANRVPISQTLRGNAGVNPIVAAPLNSGIANTSTAYSAYYGNTSPIAPVGYTAPLTLAPTNAVLPLGQPASRPFGSGLARFFNSLLGRGNTNYTSSYYRAPVTYYRPLSSVDPVSGTTVTVQQPCSSYVQQLQRVPTNSFLPLGNSGAIPLQTAGVCATGFPSANQLGYSQPGYAPLGSSLPGSTLPGTFSPPSGVGQVGAQLDPNSYGVSPIPLYDLQAGTGNSQPLGTPPVGTPLNTAPLTGGNGIDPADRQNIGQPRLESNRPNTSADSTLPGGADSYGNDTNSGYADGLYRNDLDQYGTADPNYEAPDYGADDDDGSVSDDPDSPIRLSPPVTRSRPLQSQPGRGSGLLRNEEHFTQKSPSASLSPSQKLETPPALQAPELLTQDDSARKYSSVRPIGAPEDFTPPLAGDGFQTRAQRDEHPAEMSDQTDWMSAPKLPRPNTRRPLNREGEATASSVRNRTRPEVTAPMVTVPIREATTRRQQSIRQVAAWEDAVETRQRQSAPRVSPTRLSPAKPRRSTGGWVPNR